MSKRLVFIMSDSEAYLRDETIRLYTKWGFNSSTVKSVEEWNPALVSGSMSLFGEVSMVHLDLSDKVKLKKFAEFISDKKHKYLFEKENWYGAGLIITSTHVQGTKKIQNLIDKSKGEVIKKAKPAEMRKKLMSRINLNANTKEFLETYVGEDYPILISINNQLEKMSPETQLKLTVDDLITRLPGRPGSVLPWEFINPMLEGNAKKAVDLFKRSVESNNVLISMQLSRTKLQLMYRLKLLEMSGIWNSKEQAKILGEKNGPNIWITAKTGKKIDIKVAEYLAKLALVTEANLKGYSNAEPNTIFTNFIVAACLAIKYNRVLPLNI